MQIKDIHEKAKQVGERFRLVEREVLEILATVDDEGVWAQYEYSSLFDYAVAEMKLTPATALNSIAVMRKSRVVPELKAAIDREEISVATARKLTSVITKENSEEWLDLAKRAKKLELEKAVAAANPKEAVQERVKYVAGNRLELKMGVSEDLMAQLRRAQDLASKGRAASLEDTLAEVLEFYVARKDPVVKAGRAVVKGA